MYMVWYVYGMCICYNSMHTHVCVLSYVTTIQLLLYPQFLTNFIYSVYMHTILTVNFWAFTLLQCSSDITLV